MTKAPHASVIVRNLGGHLIPLVQLFALYILFFGQYGPGGGFVGGVMLGASFIVGFLIFGANSPANAAANRLMKGDGLGLIIFVGVGGLGLIGGGEFLHYTSASIPWLEPPAQRYLGIVLAQIGVALDIAVTAVSIVISLSVVNRDEDATGA